MPQPPFALMQEAGFIKMSSSAPEGGDPNQGHAHWVFPLPDASLYADYDGARGNVVLKTDVQLAPLGPKTPLFTTLLQFNEHGADTGVRFGLDTEDDSIVMMVDIAPDDESAESLNATVLNIARQRLLWREIIERNEFEDEDLPQPPESAPQILEV